MSQASRRYFIVEASSRDSLEELVERLLRDGWSAAGGVGHYTAPTGFLLYTQALARSWFRALLAGMGRS